MKELLDKFFDKSNQSAEFPIKILHGNLAKSTLGKGKGLFRMGAQPDSNSTHAHFEIETGEVLHKERILKVVDLEDITRLEQSSRTVGFNLQNLSLRRALIVGGVSGATLFTPFPLIVEAAAIAGAGLASSLEMQIRFVCDLKEDWYFCGEMPAIGYLLADALVQNATGQRNQVPTTVTA